MSASHPHITREVLIYVNLNTEVKIYSGHTFPGSIPVAIKDQEHFALESANQVINEALCHAQLSHPHIIKAFGCFVEKGEIYEYKSVLVLELLETDLKKEIAKRREKKEPWTEEELFTYLGQLASALNYAERKGIAHRDIKPQNVFLSGETMKLGDFGVSMRLMSEGNIAATLQGTVLYISPELKQIYNHFQETGQSLSIPYDPYKSDVFSLGVTFLEMARLDPPSKIKSLIQQPNIIPELVSELGNYPGFQSILPSMLALDPCERPSFTVLEEFASKRLMEIRTIPRVGINPELRESQESESNTLIANQRCLVCGKPVLNTNWLKEVDFSRIQFGAYLSQVCSFLCFSMYISNSTCVLCQKAINTEFQLTYGMECSHVICTWACFFEFYKQTTANFSVFSALLCPICNVGNFSIRDFAGSRISLNDVFTHFSDLCQVCYLRQKQMQFQGCGHRSCFVCTNIAIVSICPICLKRATR